MKTLKEKLVQEGLIRRQAGIDMRAKIEEWLDSWEIENYTINDDLTIDVKGDDSVVLNGYADKELPDYIQFGKIKYGFFIRSSNITSLQGCPQEVGEEFDCSSCPNLESLKGCPKEVGGNFFCGHCPKLKSLEGAPKKIGGSFYCRKCGKKFTEDDVSKVSKVKYGIYV